MGVDADQHPFLTPIFSLFQASKMKTKICLICGSKMKRNGFEGYGRQRWRCKGCNKSETHKRGNAAERFEEFLKHLF